MLVGTEAVPELAVDAEMTERVDVRAGVAVHRERRAGVAAGEVHGLAHAHRVVDFGAARRVSHPELVVRIAGVLPAGHADVVLGGQVIGLAAADPRQDRCARGLGDQVETADLVLRPPGAGADLLAGRNAFVRGHRGGSSGAGQQQGQCGGQGRDQRRQGLAQVRQRQGLQAQAVVADHGGNGTDAERSGFGAVGLHALAYCVAAHVVSEGTTGVAERFGDVQQHFGIADVAVLVQVRPLHGIEHHAVGLIAAKHAGGLAGQCAQPAGGIFEVLCTHAFDIDARAVFMRGAVGPVAQDDRLGTLHRAEYLDHLRARVLQHEAAVAHLDAEFGRDLLQARGQHEAPAADHVVAEIDHWRCSGEGRNGRHRPAIGERGGGRLGSAAWLKQHATGSSVFAGGYESRPAQAGSSACRKSMKARTLGCRWREVG
ncbi:hypothetical protein G6F24_013284 [Rhizopus arrhizus]|nr:hypothetical protein G6F24_013284 [Rhizopus arrhizus]